MRYRISIDCPDEEEIIQKIIDAASEAGAGRIGNYSRGVAITKTVSTWKTEAGAHPTVGTVGEISVVNSVQIATICPADMLDTVCEAIRKVHPYEEPYIEVIKLER